MQAKRRAGRGTRTLFTLLTAALFASAPGACAPRGEAPRAEEPPLPAADTGEIPAQSTGPTSRPETRRDTLTLEGMAEPVALRLYRTPPGFPLPFISYVPPDLLSEAASSGEGDAVRFVANFGGRRNDSAYVAVLVYPEGTSGEEARRMLAAATGGSAAAAADQQRYSWALAEYRGNAGATVARGILGRQDGRFFHVFIRYPAEFGDGFPPRAAMLLEHWQWEGGSGGLGN